MDRRDLGVRFEHAELADRCTGRENADGHAATLTPARRMSTSGFSKTSALQPRTLDA
jgi:hypothetical protein